MAQLVPHDDADRAVVEAARVLETEEGHLQDPGRKHDLVLGGRVIGVDLRRRHAPPRPVDQLIQLAHVLLEGEAVEANAVVKVLVFDDRQLLVLFGERPLVTDVVGEADHVGDGVLEGKEGFDKSEQVLKKQKLKTRK